MVQLLSEAAQTRKLESYSSMKMVLQMSRIQEAPGDLAPPRVSRNLEESIFALSIAAKAAKISSAGTFLVLAAFFSTLTLSSTS
uniref:Uncharacterized protein n=1 Tax=Solanum lycopersicum TaxID=4081 RepID=A0A3Q7H0D8_SOLLC